MPKVLVTGASGFIASHLIERLKAEGCWVRGARRTSPSFGDSGADEFLTLDLRDPHDCLKAVMVNGAPVDHVYHLAADMGGIGYITTAESDLMRNNALMDVNMAYAAATAGVTRYLFSSSVCVYRDMQPGERELREDDAVPAHPDNAYGWEKLFAERFLASVGDRYPMAVRIARLQTSYGPRGAWTGGREKAPAAICRKVAQARDGETIEVWGDGTAIRSYLFIDDMVDGIVRLMPSDLDGAVNIGSSEYVSVRTLVEKVIRISGKRVDVSCVPGPVGVHARNFSNARIDSIGWRPIVSLDAGLAQTYSWIAAQVALAANAGPVEEPGT